MIRLGLQEEVDRYFESGKASQSFLKALCKGVAYAKRPEKTMYYEEKGNLLIGSAIDDLLSMGTEAFNVKYFVASKDKPSDAIMSIVQMIFDKVVEQQGQVPQENIHSFANEVLEALDYHKYQTRWKEETRINKGMELGYAYFEELKEAYGKQILSPIEYEIVSNIRMSWTTHKHTTSYFNNPDVHIFFQVPIYFTYLNVDCKALLDMVIVDTKAQTIQPIDFKTMAGSVMDFPKSVKRFGYNFQGAFYTEALKQLRADKVDRVTLASTIEELEELIEEDMEILPFKFMVETTDFKENKITGEIQYMQGSPLMYTLSDEQMTIGKYGRPELLQSIASTQIADYNTYPIKHRPILGFNDGIDLYVWHTNNGFDLDKKVIEANGDLLI